MKILYLTFDPGITYWGTKGASIHIREFTKALREAGYTVTTVIARMGESNQKVRELYELPEIETDFFETEENAQPIHAEAKAFAQNFGLKKLLKQLPTQKFDLIYERYSLFGVAGLSWAREHKLPFVLEVNAPLLEEAKTHRQLTLEPLAKAVEQYLFTQADHIVAVSQPVADYAHSVAPKAAVTVVPNGVDVKPFIRHSSNNGRKNKALFSVGFVGSLKPWHGLEFLLEAFRRLPEEENFKLVIVGDGPLRHSLEKEAQKLGLAQRVVFPGSVAFEEIPKTLKNLDVLVAPYPRLDGFYFSPLKIFEYMAAGKPIVASKIGQVAEILENEKTALLVPPENPDELASALRRLKAEHELAQRLGLEAQKAAKEKHTWKARLKIIEPIFRTLVAKKK